MLKDLKAAAVVVLVFTVLCGLAYPLAITGAAQVLAPGKADGSLVRDASGRTVGSQLIGQDFSGRDDLFQSRPSVTGYSASATAFNNRGPNQASLAVQQRRFARDYAAREQVAVRDVPADAATTSASGVDPHISVENARIQARRVSRESGLPRETVERLIGEHTEGRGAGVFGELGVNVLALNLAIEEAAR